MTADPAGIPADYSFTVFPPRHRAVMDADNAWRNLVARTTPAPVREQGRHVNPDVALWVHAAEDNARVLDIIRDAR